MVTQNFFMKLCCHSTLILSLYIFHVLQFCTSEAVTKVATNNGTTLPRWIMMFGDSILDSGNNNYLPTIAKCDFHPYGRDFKGGIATGRFTNGKTPADLLVEILGIKDLVPAYLDSKLQNTDLPTSVSFASGASGYDDQTAKFFSVLSFSDQLELFKEYIEKLKGIVGEENANKVVSESGYLVSAASVDLALTYFTIGARRLQFNVAAYTDFLVASASKFVKEIYKLGGRKMALFGAPPIGCLPFSRTVAGGPFRRCSKVRNQAAKLYNTKLLSQLDSLNASLPQARVVYIDIYNPLNDLIQNPTKYGFDVVDKGCCGTGTVELAILCNKLSPTCSNDAKYLFWDSFHPTERGYRLITQRIVRENINKLL
ncbi:hypothetical protein LguiB_005622 [Lonicera macranthoides]